jgi:hypothetical protein
VRERPKESGQLPRNWLLSGVNPSLEKGATPPGEAGEPWFHIRQNKHHRWSLDQSQIYQYHLGGVLHPDVRWWEAIDLPRLEVNFIEVAEVTLGGLVCQDLAHNDDVAALIRSVGPTIVLTALLDGPQLTSRWAARYASVLADDPGSAVLTLTSFGMAERSRPHGHDASPIIALWKDPSRGVREIRLDPGAYGVVLTVCMSRSPRRSADGRWPIDNGTVSYDVAIHQVKPAKASSDFRQSQVVEPTSRVLEIDDLTILTAWAEGVAEVLAHGPGGAPRLLAEAAGGAAWRGGPGLPQPSAQFGNAIEALSKVVMTAGVDESPPTFESVLNAASEYRHGECRIDAMVRQVLRAMLEERQTRHAAGSTARTRDDF